MPATAQFQSLISRVRRRDEDAARELVTRYETAIRRVVRIHLRDARVRRLLDSNDVCQSVLATFFTRTALGEYEIDTPEQLIKLLTSITKNKLVNEIHRLQAQRRDIRRTVGLNTDGFLIEARAANPLDQLSARELLEKVRAGLDSQERYLADQRSLGRTWVELAEESGGTDVALRKKLTRALSRVMCELGLGETDDA